MLVWFVTFHAFFLQSAYCADTLTPIRGTLKSALTLQYLPNESQTRSIKM